MPKLNIQDLELKDRKVFLRVDFNVPLKDGKIANDLRIRASLPTIRYGLEHGAALVIASHLGRPKGIPKPEFSLAPVAARLREMLDRKVTFVPDCIGQEAEKAVAAAVPGDVILLENLRFHPGEEKNDTEFAKKLAAGTSLYINDAFGVSHRAHASTKGITQFVHQSAAGFLLEKELRYLAGVLESPECPFVAIVGGAKISEKIEVIENLLDKVNRLLIGGAMMFTFQKCLGKNIGKSLCEEDKIELAKRLLDKAGDKIMLPSDVVASSGIDDAAGAHIVSADAIPDGEMGLDIGPETVARYAGIIRSAKTIVWNGPMGVFEKDAFAAGTMAIAKAVAYSEAVSIVGGGESATAIANAELEDMITHISTGGGASLALLSGRVLPGVAALTDKVKVRTPVIAGNWKMNKVRPEARALAHDIREGRGDWTRCEVVIAPPFTALAAVAEEIRGSGIVLAAQNVHWEDKGAFTGEISLPMLKDAGCGMVILGHSERRQYFGETDILINRKVRAVLRAGLQPIICIGETLAERESGKHENVVSQQLAGGLAGLTDEDLLRIIFAYEPVWAIGTGRTASPETAQEMHGYIRGWLSEKFGKNAETVRILYGGSVNPDNINALMRQPDIDGALVGGACLEAESFLRIVRFQSIR